MDSRKGVTREMGLKPLDIERARANVKPYKLFDKHGLFLLVSASGSKWWRLKYRFGGVEKQLSLGTYPAVTLAKARESRDAARKLLAEGIDPSEKRKAEKAVQRAEEARRQMESRFKLDRNGAITFRLGGRLFTLTPTETAELRVFLDANQGATRKEPPCP